MSEQNNNEASPQLRPVTLADLLGEKIKLVSHGIEKVFYVITDLGDGTVEVRKGGLHFIVDSAIEPDVDVYLWDDANERWLAVLYVENQSIVCMNGKWSKQPVSSKMELTVIAGAERILRPSSAVCIHFCE